MSAAATTTQTATTPNDGAPSPPIRRSRRELLRLWGFVRPHWRPLAGALLLLPLTAALQLLPPYLLKVAIDKVIVPGHIAKLPLLAALLFAVMIGQQLAGFGHSVLLQICGQRAMHDLRVQAHRHVLGLSARFFDRTPVGVLITRVTNDVESIAEAFASGLIAMVGDIFKLIGIVVAMIWLDLPLALLTFAVLPVLIAIVLLFQRLLRRAYRVARRRLALINATLQEQISGMKIVQIFGRQHESQRIFDEVNRSYRDTYQRSIKLDATLFALVELLGTLTIALLLWYGGLRVGGNAVTLGLLVAFIEYVQRFFEPIRDMSAKFAVMQQALVAAERVFALLATNEPDCPSAKPLPMDAGNAIGAPGANTRAKGDRQHRGASISFDRVTFGYAPDAPILSELTFHVDAGQSVAVVGATGAGKSTIARLLVRLYEIESGSIRLDGRDIRQLQPSLLRRRVVILAQDVFLFAGTVRRNIALDDPTVTEEAVERAAERVGVNRLLDLDAPVTERGSNLSLGERQLVVFARALARQPDVLVLDEATASVDPESERMVQEGIATLMQERTSIIIAHRLSTIERVDRVLVLHHGRLAEAGTHQQLLAYDGIYARLQRLQLVTPSS